MSKEWKIHPGNSKCVMIPNNHGHLLLFTDSEEDASLIAAAPELRAALEDLLYQAYQSKEEGGWCFEEARSAIAKARGQK